MDRPFKLTREDYAVQDCILQYISSNFVSIQKDDEKRFKNHLNFVINEILNKMKAQDEFFCQIFQKQHVSGSFWDNLKVGKPEEFDQNFILQLPGPLAKNLKFKPSVPSFMCLNVKDGLKELQSSPKWRNYKKIDSWVDENGFIRAEKVRFWMESVIHKALTDLPLFKNEHILVGGDGNTYKLCTRKSGPAITLEVDVISSGNCKFQIDIVPAFEFTQNWPKHIRGCPDDAPIKSWHVVPKPLKEAVDSPPRPLLWRMSFHDQESHLIYNLYHFKAVMKLIKKLRDMKLDQHLLSSYAIKTVFLWERDAQETSFWQEQLSFLFLHMLQVLLKYLAKKKIPFYWDKNHNLLGNLTNEQLNQMYNTLVNILNRILTALETTQDYFAIARELLDVKQYQQIRSDIMIEERDEKIIAKPMRQFKKTKF